MRRDNRYRCDGCLRSWREVRGGPMLNADVWARICILHPRDVLCEPCIRDRIERVYHRQMRIGDLLPCPINVICGHYQELAPPRLLADWARYVVEVSSEFSSEIGSRRGLFQGGDRRLIFSSAS
jgi:hypothetical protein